MKEQFQRRPRGTGRPFIQVRIPGAKARTTLWADHDPAYQPSWDVARLNAWAFAAREDHRRRYRTAHTAGVAQQAAWTLEDYVTERCKRARATHSPRELARLEGFTNTVGNTLRDPTSPLRGHMLPAEVSSQVISDFVVWNRSKGQKDVTAMKKLTHIGRCIRECEPDADDGLLPAYTAFRARVTRAQRQVNCEASIPRATFFEPHDAVQIARFIDEGTWSRTHRDWTLRDVFLLLCATGIDFGEAAAVTPLHIVKLVKEGRTVKALPWEMRARWRGAEGHYAINFGRGLDGREDWRNPASIASHKRKSAGVRLAPICVPEAGETMATLVAASVDPHAPLFEGLAIDTLREALQRTCQKLDRWSGSTICLQGLPNLKSCRRSFSQWGERAGVREAFLRLAMGQYGAGAHGKHYKVLTPQDAHKIASIGSSYWTRTSQGGPEVGAEVAAERQPDHANAAE